MAGSIGDIGIAITIAICAMTIAVFAIWRRNQANYWRKRNIPHGPFSILPSRKDIKMHTTKILSAIYEISKAKGHGMFGIFKLGIPVLIITDLDLIKRVFVTNFDHFMDRPIYHNGRDDPLSRNLVRLTGDEWKIMRSQMTPAFTSGKIRQMVPTVVRIAERLVVVLQKNINEMKNENVAIRDYLACYTTDVIGKVAFGLDCNSLANPQTKFRQMGDKAFTSFRPLVESIGFRFKKLFNLLGIRVFPKEMYQFYASVISDTIKSREEAGEKNNDFFDLMLNLTKGVLRKGTSIQASQEDMVAQAFVFFIGGFETSSSTLSFIIYALCLNPEIQNKARDEIFEVLSRFNNELTYDNIKEMKYTEKIFLETLRKYPIVAGLPRVCTKDYTFPNTSSVISKGTPIIVPVYPIHHDPEIYPNPDKFDPERFSEEAIQQRHPMAVLPFGAGPRVCIAERFAKMQTLVALVLLLQNFHFSLSPKMPSHPEFDVSEKRILRFKGGIHVTIDRYNK